MSQTFSCAALPSYATLPCMTVGAALAWCGRCICAACAWVQHLHGCSMCMVAALALLQQMHVCGVLMLVPCWPPPRPRPCTTHMCMLQHLHASTRARHPRFARCLALVLLKPMPAQPHMDACWLPRQPTWAMLHFEAFFLFWENTFWYLIEVCTVTAQDD